MVSFLTCLASNGSLLQESTLSSSKDDEEASIPREKRVFFVQSSLWSDFSPELNHTIEISQSPSPNHLSIDKNTLLWNGRGPTKLSHHHPPPLTALWSLNSSEGRNPLSMAEETVVRKDNSGH